MKETTKACWNCGSTRLRLFTSLSMKQCDECLTKMDWYLAEKQKPLVGSSRDSDSSEKSS